MREMTKEFLLEAFAGESQAHMRYAIFAEEADKKGMPKMANLFRAIAKAEMVHAKNHYKALKLVGDMPSNIQQCIDGENHEVEEMYPVYNEVAKFQEEKEAQRTTHYALEAEKIHEDMYKKARKLAEKGEDYNADTIYICPVWGHTAIGEAPEKCPVCGVPRERFEEFSA